MNESYEQVVRRRRRNGQGIPSGSGVLDTLLAAGIAPIDMSRRPIFDEIVEEIPAREYLAGIDPIDPPEEVVPEPVIEMVDINYNGAYTNPLDNMTFSIHKRKVPEVTNPEFVTLQDAIFGRHQKPDHDNACQMFLCSYNQFALIPREKKLFYRKAFLRSIIDGTYKFRIIADDLYVMTERTGIEKMSYEDTKFVMEMMNNVGPEVLVKHLEAKDE